MRMIEIKKNVKKIHFPFPQTRIFRKSSKKLTDSEWKYFNAAKTPLTTFWTSTSMVQGKMRGKSHQTAEMFPSKLILFILSQKKFQFKFLRFRVKIIQEG